MGLSGRRTIQLRWSLRTPLRRGDKLGLTLCSAGGRTGDPEPETEPVTQFCRALWTLRNLTLPSKRPGPLAGSGAGRGSAGLKVQTRGPWEVRGGRRTEDARTGPRAVRPQGTVSGCPPGTLQGCGELGEGTPLGRGAAARAEKPCDPGRKREEESRAETGSWRGIPGNGGAETASPGALPTLPRPVIPAPPPPARVTLAVWPRRCPRGASLEPTRSSRTPPTLLTPARRSRPRCELLLALSAGTSGAGQRLAEGE